MSNENKPNRFMKRPVTVEAIQWTGNNEAAIWDFVGKHLQVSRPPHQVEHDHEIPNNAITITIPTLEGNMTASCLDWIIKGVKGEFYPCKPDVFEQTYILSGEGENKPLTAEDLAEHLAWEYRNDSDPDSYGKLIETYKPVVKRVLEYAAQQVAAVLAEKDERLNEARRVIEYGQLVVPFHAPNCEQWHKDAETFLSGEKTLIPSPESKS